MLTNTSTLVANSIYTPHTGVLGKRLAAHLLRRCSFHFTKQKVDQLATMTASQAVDDLFDNPSPTSYMVKPFMNDVVNSPTYEDWIDDNNSIGNETRRRQAVCGWWMRNALYDPTAHHKTAFFLHTTFTTSHKDLNVPTQPPVNGQNQNLTRDVSRYLYDHLRLLNWLTTNGTDLKTVARKITLDNLMLCYLDNRQNFFNGLIENYSREFLELFTIGESLNGIPNYTEPDVTLAAAVFSGFSTKVRRNSSDIDPVTGFPMGTPYPNLHTPGNKQFSANFVGPNNPVIGQANPTTAGMFTEMDQFIDMVFDQPATALNYANKIYRYFLSITVDTMVAGEMQNELIQNGFDYIDTIKLLLKSEHFYTICDSGTTNFNGNILKSPFEMIAESMSFFLADLPPIVNFLAPTPDEVYDHFYRFPTIFLFNSYGEDSDMLLFGPEDVAGHEAYYQEPLWDQNWYVPGTLPARFGLGSKLVQFWNSNPNIKTRIDTVRYADYLDLQGLDVSDPDILLDELMVYLLPQEVSMMRRDVFMQIFLLNLDPLNWTFLWNCYKNTPPFPPTGCGLQPGDSSGIKPHLDALVVSLLSAHEFQLK